MHNNRIHTRLPEVLAEHVLLRCSEGIYDNSSEYIRDLIRQDYEKTEREKWKRLKSKLADAANAPFEEFIEIDPQASLEEFKQRRLAKKEA